MNSLSKGSLTEVKALSNPPAVVLYTLSAVFVQLGHDFDNAQDWKYIKKALANFSLLNQIKNYDKDHVDPKVYNNTKAFLSGGYSVGDIKRVSFAA